MLAPGSTFGSFRILDILGTGSQGVVYHALDTRLDRIVALKMIHDQYASSEEYRKLIVNEAKAAARIDSPHVVKIWEHGQIDGQLYISLEFVDGPDLRTACEVLSHQQKIEIAKQLLRGISAAHKVGLLHRDLKPQNVKISKDVVLKIMDFGLAKFTSGHASELALQIQTQTVGRPEGFVGTICYAAPEQFSGEPLTFSSDIFSSGVMLYEMFTGRRPFDGPNPAGIIYSILNEEPSSPGQINRDLPLWLDQVLLQAIAKRPIDRFRSAQEMLTVMEDAEGHSERTITAPVIRPRQTVTMIDLRNLSADPGWDYFSEGFTEEVIRELGRRTNLIVSAQPSQIHTRDVKELVNKCRSDFVITGTLLKWQQRVRMSLNVYRSRGLQLVLGESYESEIDGLFSMLSSAATDVASRLALETGSPVICEVDTLHMNVGAYEYYLKGRAYYQTSKPDDLTFAETMYRRALEIDSNLALAHAGLSDLYTLKYMFYYDRSPGTIESAKDEAVRALAISPRLAEGYRSLGRYYQVLGDYPNAEKSLQKAIDCNPKFALAYRAMAWLTEVQGDHEASMRWARKALELAPLDLETLVLIGRLYMDTRRYTAALSVLQRAIELGPDYGRAYHELGSVYMKIGAFDEALKGFEAASKFKGDPNSYIEAGYVHLSRSEYESAQCSFAASISEGLFPFAASYYLGLVEQLRGNSDRARVHYEKSIQFVSQCDPREASDAHIKGYHSLSLASLGRRDESRRLLAEIIREKDIDGEILHRVARTFAVLGDTEKAREYCLLALTAHAGPTEAELKVDPILKMKAISLQ